MSERFAPPEDLSRYALLSIGAALVTISLKSVAWWVTGSVGLLADAAESLVNLVAAIFAFYALKISIRPPDKDHPFGHSKAEYFSAQLEGVMIFVAAVVIIQQAINRIMNPIPIENIGIGVAISAVAGVINGVVALILIRAGKRYRSLALQADGHHLMTDVVTSIAVIIGVVVVAITKQPILDPIIALALGVNIIFTGIQLIRKSVNGLMDIAMPEEEVAQVESILDSFRNSDIDFHAVRTRESGNRRFLAMHVLVPGAWSVKRGHDFTEDVVETLMADFPDLRITAHLEPREDPRSYEDMDI